MKIVVYSHYFTPEIGAPSARIFDFSREWMAAGHSVQVVTCFPNHPVGRMYPGYRAQAYMLEDFAGIKVHRHWTYVTPNKGFVKKTLGHISYLPSSLCISNPHVAKPDVVVASSPTLFAAMAGAGAGWRFRVPFVMEIRDLWPAIFVELEVLRNRHLIRLLEFLEMSLYQRAGRVVTVTEAFRNNLIERGIPKEKVHTVTNGADINFWNPEPKPAGLNRDLGLEGKFVVLYIGAHGISHGLEKVVDAAVLLQDHPVIKFVFVGAGAEKEKLIRHASDLGLANTLFLDPVDKDKVKEFYALADACLVPLKDIPLFETFIPSKMFEIMAMERPIIGSVAGEPADILMRSKGAMVVRPEDSRAIADSLLFLYQNPEKGREMGMEGRKFVRKYYSRTFLARQYLEVLQDAISGYQMKL